MLVTWPGDTSGVRTRLCHYWSVLCTQNYFTFDRRRYTLFFLQMKKRMKSDRKHSNQYAGFYCYCLHRSSVTNTNLSYLYVTLETQKVDQNTLNVIYEKKVCTKAVSHILLVMPPLAAIPWLKYCDSCICSVLYDHLSFFLSADFVFFFAATHGLILERTICKSCFFELADIRRLCASSFHF